MLELKRPRDRASRLCAGFVDLVGYTALSLASTTRTKLATITRFEQLLGDVLGRGGGRLVKLIGDGAMFVVDEPEQACRLALDLVNAFDSDSTVPPARVGLAYGTWRTGPWFPPMATTTATSSISRLAWPQSPIRARR